MILPMDTLPQWQRFPKATLFLICLNLTVFSLWQTGDKHRWQQIINQYQQSPLPALEYPIFISHLYQTGRAGQAEKLEALWKQGQHLPVLKALLGDISFTNMISTKKLDFWGEQDFSPWFEARQKINRELQGISWIKFGLHPDRDRPATYLFYQFMHQNWPELMINMIILLLIGWSLELLIGSFYLFMAYIASGITAGLLFAMLEPSHYRILTGSTYSINALVALFVVWHRLNKVRLYYFTVYHHHFFKIPAWTVTPFWLSMLSLQFFLTWPDHPNPYALAGGLISGSLLGLALKNWLIRKPDQSLPVSDPTPEPDEPYRTALDAALKQLERFNFVDGERKLNQLQEDYPKALEPRVILYNLKKGIDNPSTQAERAQTIFSLLRNSPSYNHQIQAVFDDYAQHNPVHSIEQVDLLNWLNLLIRYQQTQQAKKLVNACGRDLAHLPQFQKSLSLLIDLLNHDGDTDTARRFGRLIG